jgi:hypothetical protein
VSRRHPNPQLVKIHRSYSVEEISATLRVHKNTVRAWVRQGLKTIDSERPALIHGRVLADFLRTRRQANKQRCTTGEMFCLRCRKPVTPAGNIAEYLPITAISGNLRGICPCCESLIHRRTSLAQLEIVRGNVEIIFQQAEERIAEGAGPSVNCDSEATE